MSVYSDKLRELIEVTQYDANGNPLTDYETYADKVVNLTASIAEHTAMIAELTEQKEAIEYGVLDVIDTDLQTTLEAKRISRGGCLVITYDNYCRIGGNYTDDSNLTDWEILKYTGYGVTYVSGTELLITGLHASDFPTDAYVCAKNGTTTSSEAQVVDAQDTTEGTTELTVDSSIFEADVADIAKVDYRYDDVNWDSDATILTLMDDFDFALDHLSLDLGISGTYGIWDMIAKLTTAKALLTTNKNKYSDALTYYEDYATPT